MGGTLRLFFHLNATGGFGGSDELFLDLRRNHVVVRHLHLERAAALGHGGEVETVSKHLGHGDFGLHHGVAAFVVHALNSAAAGIQIAHDAAGKFIGHSDLHLHDGLQQRRFGLFHPFLESDAAGELEGKLVGIYIVIRAIVKNHSEIHHRESGQVAALGGFDDAFLYRGNVVLGNGAAEDVVDELKIAAARQRLHLDLAITVLAVASGLLFMAALHVGSAPDSLAIRDFRRLQNHFGVVPLLQFSDHYLDVLLAGAGDQKFLGLRV